MSNNCSARGADVMRYIALANFGRKCKMLLLEQYNVFYERFHSSWTSKLGILIPVFKSENWLLDIASLHPIALLSCIKN